MNDKQFMELQGKIHSTRFSLMQHYMFLYGGELKGHKCKMAEFMSDELNDIEADNVMNAIMEMEFEESVLSRLLAEYKNESLRRNEELIKSLKEMNGK